MTKFFCIFYVEKSSSFNFFYKRKKAVLLCRERTVVERYVVVTKW